MTIRKIDLSDLELPPLSDEEMHAKLAGLPSFSMTMEGTWESEVPIDLGPLPQRDLVMKLDNSRGTFRAPADIRGHLDPEGFAFMTVRLSAEDRRRFYRYINPAKASRLRRMHHLYRMRRAR